MGVFDSMNAVLAPLVLELEKRGHNVTVVVSDEHDAISTKAFKNNGVSVRDAEDFNTNELDQIDAVIAAPLRMRVYRRILSGIDKRCIPTFSFATLFSSVLMKMRADVVFTIGTDKFKEFEDNYLNYRCIAVGNPQYDTLVPYRKKGVDPEDIHKILIVDQGGYPYGEKGKQQLADTLISIATKNPSIEFKIKPRYLKSERGIQIHTSSEHLSDYIKVWPDNLTEYDVPTDLEKIAPEYDAMITTWSTAFMDALVLDMPLILISGLSSLDVFDVRKQRIAEAYGNLERTGCVYNYKDLIETDDVINKFKKADASYTERTIFHAGETASDKIAKIIEYYCNNISGNGLELLEKKQITYDNFVANPDCFGTCRINTEIQSFKNIAIRRHNLFLQDCVYINRCMGNVLDLSSIAKDEPGFDQYKSWEDLKPAVKEWEQQFEHIRSEYFSREDIREKVQQDLILQDYYFEWLYNTKQYAMITDYNGTILAEGSYYYYLARINLDSGNREKAFDLLGKYLVITESREIPQTIRERRIELMIEPFTEGSNRYHWYRLLYKNNLGSILDGFEQKQVRANSIYELIRIRSANADGNYSKSKYIYLLYNEQYTKQMKSSKKGIKHSLRKGFKSLMHRRIGIEYKKAERELKNGQSKSNS